VDTKDDISLYIVIDTNQIEYKTLIMTCGMLLG